ncbi:MAG: glycine cleavage system aminomethyltransferase GcvT [Trueperaceae bacterium]|nr:glycine cleavage system aminomethyltransferase GcvT [Trueperaceae bacterium]
MQRTPLYERHRDLGARLVDFAGWDMPIQYESGINQEHLAVRQDAGVFDVSHMGELRVRGAEAMAFLRYTTLNDVGRLRVGRGHYSMLPNESGGLVDDLYVYRDADDDFLVVANAGNVDTVLDALTAHAADFAVEIVDESDRWGLLALQGPAAAVRLERVAGMELTSLRKNATRDVDIGGLHVRVARTGYTGEDGFELFTAWDDTPAVWDLLIEDGALPCGLGARDTLRLEAGFPLYGHELTSTTNPLCTPFAWVVKDKPFFGRDAMWGAPCDQRLVGLKVTGRGIPRQGYTVLDADGTSVGMVTSGTLSPLTRESIAMAWIDSSLARDGTDLAVVVRAQAVPATVTTPPFYTP